MIADDDYISSGVAGEIDEIVTAFDISDEEAEVYQRFTEQILTTNENPQMKFISNKKTGSLTPNQQSDSEWSPCMHNVIREKNGPPIYAIVMGRKLLLHFTIFFLRFIASRNLHIYNY